MNEPSDSHLVARARRGQMDAFEALVERHRAVAYRVAARIAGRDEAEDVTQDAFLRAYHHLGDFAGRGSFRSWILQITRNAALNHIARRRPEPVGTAAEVQDGDASGELARVGSPVSALETSERRDRLELKLGGLRPEHRTVLVLRDMEGLSYEEIAEITESPLGSVKGRLHRARHELIGLLRANTYDWELPK